MDLVLKAVVVLGITLGYCKGVTNETTCYGGFTIQGEDIVHCNGLLLQPVCLVCNVSRTVTELGWYIYDRRITHNQFPLREGHAGGIDVNQCHNEKYSLRLKNTSKSNHNALYTCMRRGKIISQFKLKLQVVTHLFFNSTQISKGKLLIQRGDGIENLQCILEGAVPPFTLIWSLNGIEHVKKIFNYSEQRTSSELYLDVNHLITHSEVTCSSEGRYITNDSRTVQVIFVDVHNEVQGYATQGGFAIKLILATAAAVTVSVVLIFFIGKGIHKRQLSQSANHESTSQVYYCVEDRKACNENDNLVSCPDTRISVDGLYEYWIGTYSIGGALERKCFARKLSDQGTLRQAHEFKLLARKLLQLKEFPAITSVLSINIENEPFSIVYEFLEYGSLRDFVISRYQHTETGVVQRGKMSLKDQVKELLTFAVNIAQAMEFIESQQFCHPFLALKKVLLTTDCTCKLYDILPTDMAMTKVKEVLKKKNPPTAWMAPETIFLGEYTPTSDAWSYSVLLWELLTFGDIPHEGSTNAEIEDSVRNGNVLPKPQSCPGSVYETMLLSWQSNGEMRPTFRVFHKILNDLLTGQLHNTSESRLYATVKPKTRTIAYDQGPKEPTMVFMG